MMQTIHSCEVRRKVVNIMSSEERPKLPVNSLVGALNLIEAILNEMMDEYAVAVALKALKKSEYITQKMREEDNRRNFVELTEKGRKLVEESCDFFDMLDEQMYVGFSESEKEQLCDYFDRIYENMERLKNAAMEGQNETV